MSDRFVINRLKAKPVEYSVHISHFVSGGEWQMKGVVFDIDMDVVNRKRVADDLRAYAKMLDEADE